MDRISIDTELAIIQNKTFSMVEPSDWNKYGGFITINFPMNKLFKYIKNKYHKNDKRFTTHQKIEDFYIVNYGEYN